jgi:DNA-binding winged helix-turn-helix (wHTH) protein
MQEDLHPRQRLRFGVFELDLRAGELRKHGLRIRIQEQRFQVLALLVGRPGDVITREELQKKLWPADNFVDFDCGLNKAIWGARPRFWLISGEQFFGVRQFGTLRACLTVFEELCVVGSSEPQFLE